MFDVFNRRCKGNVADTSSIDFYVHNRSLKLMLYIGIKPPHTQSGSRESILLITPGNN